MHTSLQRRLWLFLMMAVVLAGCGRKMAPQPVSTNAEKPQIVDLQHEAIGNVMRLDFVLRGNPAGVGYQIDRTMIDPYCQCPGFWRRYVSKAAMPRLANSKTKKMLLLSTKVEYVFRIRAVDVDGNFGPWSKMMRARGVDLFHK